MVKLTIWGELRGNQPLKMASGRKPKYVISRWIMVILAMLQSVLEKIIELKEKIVPINDQITTDTAVAVSEPLKCETKAGEEG